MAQSEQAGSCLLHPSGSREVEIEVQQGTRIEPVDRGDLLPRMATAGAHRLRDPKHRRYSPRQCLPSTAPSNRGRTVPLQNMTPINDRLADVVSRAGVP